MKEVHANDRRLKHKRRRGKGYQDSRQENRKADDSVAPRAIKVNLRSPETANLTSKSIAIAKAR